jgi:KRAB domain-containing zinc finger protein
VSASWLLLDWSRVLNKFVFTFRFPQPTTSKNKTQGSFECDNCGKVFLEKQKIRGHVQNHVKFAIHECDFCDKTYKLKRILQQHIFLQHLNTDKRLKCEICGVKSESKWDLKAHRKTHNASRFFECLVCGKRFNKKTYLASHSFVHSDRRDFKCTICEKSFFFFFNSFI